MELCRNIFNKFYLYFKEIKIEFKHHSKTAQKITEAYKNANQERN